MCVRVRERGGEREGRESGVWGVLVGGGEGAGSAGGAGGKDNMIHLRDSGSLYKDMPVEPTRAC